MGAGRKPIPDVIKLERGTLQAEKMRFMPPSDDTIPDSPFDAGTVAQVKWDEVTQGLHRLGLIDSLDKTHIEAYCKAYQLAIEADELVKRRGIVLASTNGNPVKNPACTVSADAWNKVRQLGNDLGLNWISRTKMNSGKPKEKPKDKGEKYLA